MRIALLLVVIVASSAFTAAKTGKVPSLEKLLGSFETLAPPPTPKELATRLLTAAEAGDAATALDLLEAGAPTEIVSSHKPPEATPLIHAAAGGHISIVESLLKHGAPLDTRDTAGQTALAHAFSNPTPATAIVLLKHGASPAVTTPSGEPAAVFAARTGTTALLRAIVAHHSDRTPLPHLSDALTFAVSNKAITDARILLEAGASAVPFESGGPNALDLAVRNGDSKMAQLILDHHGPDLLDTVHPGLLTATVNDGNPELLESLLAHGASPDTSYHDGVPTPLDLAVDRGDVRSATHLLHHCAATGDHLATALKNANHQLVDLLLDNGADASTATVDGEPPLLAAIRAGDQKFAARLLDAGADPAATGRENQSALAVAVALRQPGAIALLLAAGADPNTRLNDPVSGEFIGLIEGGKSLKYYLKRDKRFTPIMIAAGLADHDSIKTLLANGASRGVYTKSWKRYPVSFAFASKDIYAQQLLLGRDPEKEDPAEQRKVLITLSSQKATLFKNGKIIATTKISSGKKSTPTPKGQFVISDKHRHHTSSIYHVSMPYFQRLSGEAFGFHTGYVPNYPASHGCIRMPNANASKFFSLTKVGDPVTIID